MTADNQPKDERAVALGQLGKGHRKTLSSQERLRRREWMRILNHKRKAQNDTERTKAP